MDGQQNNIARVRQLLGGQSDRVTGNPWEVQGAQLERRWPQPSEG
jgi:hypothetical protein